VISNKNLCIVCIIDVILCFNYVLLYNLRVPDVYTEFRKRVENESRVRSTIKMADTMNPVPDDISEGDIPSLEELGVQGIIHGIYSCFSFSLFSRIHLIMLTNVLLFLFFVIM